ncbi:hypothetical protein HZ326_20831 [Fusarium oxysporum f. sp. albedinis]|nr:hypothetical protein HZ326_20831 [Fusarium oxysporum f. sp. albedinis]
MALFKSHTCESNPRFIELSISQFVEGLRASRYPNKEDRTIVFDFKGSQAGERQSEIKNRRTWFARFSMANYNLFACPRVATLIIKLTMNSIRRMIIKEASLMLCQF